MNTKALLIVTALLEVGAGVALVAVPSLSAEILLGEGLSSPQAFVVARIAGIALSSVGVACWLGKNSEPRAQLCQVAGMLIYNLGVPVVLLQGWMASALQGPGLWPASLLHTGLAIWCALCLRSIR